MWNDDTSQTENDRDFEQILRSTRPNTTPRAGFKEDLLGRMLERAASLKTSAAPTRRRLLGFWYRAACVLATLILVATAAWWLFEKDISVASADFAEMLRRIGSAKTVAFDMTFRLPNQPNNKVQVAISFPGRSRVALSDGSIQINDVTKAKMLSIRPATRIATLMSSLPGQPLCEPLEELRLAVASQGRFLEKQKYDGRETELYEVATSRSLLRVWVDPLEELPVRIESRPAAPSSGKVLAILEHFRWNEPVPDSFFALDAPAGYEMRVHDNDGSEQCLVNLLKMLAASPDDPFPAFLDMQTVLNIFDAKYPGQRIRYDPSVVGAPSYSHINDTVREELRTNILGLKFIDKVRANGKWQYAGKGIRRGEKVPVCWWKSPEQQTYRVIYGDLTVKDVAKEYLPAAERASSPQP